MATKQTKSNNAKQTGQSQQYQDNDIDSMSFKELEIIFAESLLDQVDTAQQQIRNIQKDMSLLQTLENALCLVSENMAKVRRLAEDMVSSNPSKKEKSLASDAIRNLMMVNMLIIEDTEYDDHLLFHDNVIRLHSSETSDLTFETEKIPEIRGVEDGDFQAILDSLGKVAQTINRQYERINTIMLQLLDNYRQLQCEIDFFRKAFPNKQLL